MLSKVFRVCFDFDINSLFELCIYILLSNEVTSQYKTPTKNRKIMCAVAQRKEIEIRKKMKMYVFIQYVMYKRKEKKL